MKTIVCLLWIAIIIIFSSCSANKNWFVSHDYSVIDLKSFEAAFVLIPETTIPNISTIDSSKRRFKNFEERTIHVDSFFIFSYEITNIGYLAFLFDLRNTDTTLYKSMYPDMEAWRSKFESNEPLNSYYLAHPHYKNFPVVGITYEQANYYCKWLTKKYNTSKGCKFKNAEFKLPTKSQWFVAAIGNDFNKIFPWEGNSLQNSNGQWMANFKIIDQVQILKDSGYVNCYNNSRFLENCLRVSEKNRANTELTITKPVNSYYPNFYGLYNMSGNVEEYMREKGISKGGSWYDTGYYLQLEIEELYEMEEITSCQRGFRIVMEITK